MCGLDMMRADARRTPLQPHRLPALGLLAKPPLLDLVLRLVFLEDPFSLRAQMRGNLR